MVADRSYRLFRDSESQSQPTTISATRPRRDTTKAQQRIQNDLRTFGKGEHFSSVSPEPRPDRKRKKTTTPAQHVTDVTANVSEDLRRSSQPPTPSSQFSPDEHNRDQTKALAPASLSDRVRAEKRKRPATDTPNDAESITTVLAPPSQQTPKRTRAQFVRLKFCSHGKPVIHGASYPSQIIKRIGKYTAAIEASQDETVSISDDMPFHEDVITYMLEFVISKGERLPPLSDSVPSVQEMMNILQVQELARELSVSRLTGALADKVRICPGMTADRTKTLAMMAHWQHEDLSPVYPGFKGSALELALRALLCKHYHELKMSGLLRELNRQGGRLSDMMLDIVWEQQDLVVKTEPVE